MVQDTVVVHDSVTTLATDSDCTCTQEVLCVPPSSPISIYGDWSPLSFVGVTCGVYPAANHLLYHGVDIIFGVTRGWLMLCDGLGGACRCEAPGVLRLSPGPVGIMLRRVQSDDSIIVQLELKQQSSVDEPSAVVWTKHPGAIALGVGGDGVEVVQIGTSGSTIPLSVSSTEATHREAEGHVRCTWVTEGTAFVSTQQYEGALPCHAYCLHQARRDLQTTTTTTTAAAPLPPAAGRVEFSGSSCGISFVLVMQCPSHTEAPIDSTTSSKESVKQLYAAGAFLRPLKVTTLA